MTLEDIGRVVGLTRERVRQIEVKTLQMLKASGGRRGWRGWGATGSGFRLAHMRTCVRSGPD